MPKADTLVSWYKTQVEAIDPKGMIVRIDPASGLVVYSPTIQSDESNQRPITPEELVHALAICMLVSDQFKYPLEKVYHEKHYAHGSKGSLSFLALGASQKHDPSLPSPPRARKGVGLHYKAFSLVFETLALMTCDLAAKEFSFRRNSRLNCDSRVNRFCGRLHKLIHSLLPGSPVYNPRH